MVLILIVLSYFYYKKY